MYAAQSTKRRGGFTLVEMLVVITIMLALAALGTAFLPRFLDNQYQTRAVDQLSQWLLTAKQRAKRDGLPTGVRILFNSSLQANQLEYIQQPDPYTAGICTGVNKNDDGTATFLAGSVDFQGAALQAGQADQALVQPGDYLEVNGGGSVYLIIGASAQSLTLANTQFNLPTSSYPYRIIRQPRRLLGEDVLTLPQDMVINLSTGFSLNVPIRQIAGLTTAYEILFSPSGSVIGQGTPSGKILLWVCNAPKSVINPYDPGAVTLLSVQIRTGFIAAHPISLNGDYYQFTEDGRSSGM